METIKIKHELFKEITKKYSLKLILLFGSQIKGKTHQESDYDIAYLADKNLSFEDEGNIIIELTRIIKIKDERLINLSNIRKAGAFLLKEIFDRHQILFYEDKNIYDSYKIFAIKNFLENRPLFDLRDSLIEKYFVNHA